MICIILFTFCEWANGPGPQIYFSFNILAPLKKIAFTQQLIGAKKYSTTKERVVHLHLFKKFLLSNQKVVQKSTPKSASSLKDRRA